MTAPSPIEQQFDAILADLRGVDVIERALARRIAALDAKIAEYQHQKRVQQAAQRENDKRLKKQAEEFLRKQQGVQVLPGFRAVRETRAQFNKRMADAAAAVRAQLQQTDGRAGETTN